MGMMQHFAWVRVCQLRLAKAKLCALLIAGTSLELAEDFRGTV